MKRESPAIQVVEPLKCRPMMFAYGRLMRPYIEMPLILDLSLMPGMGNTVCYRHILKCRVYILKKS